MRIYSVVGPYPSRRVGDYIVLIDTLNPPRKCPLNCIYCSIKGESISTTKPLSLVTPSNIVYDLDRLYGKAGVMETILFNGLGDPLLNVFTPDNVREVLGYCRRESIEPRLLVKTTLYPIVYYRDKLFLQAFDKIYVKIDAVSSDLYDLVNDPCCSLKPSVIAKVIASLPTSVREKIVVEYTIVDTSGYGNWVREAIEELIVFLKKTRLYKILLTTLHRPPASQGVKPVSKRIIENVSRMLVDEGFLVEALYEPLNTRYKGIVEASVEDIYNLLLRRPLTLLELRNAFNIPYSDIAYTLDYLEKNNLVEKTVWRNKVYYRGLY